MIAVLLRGPSNLFLLWAIYKIGYARVFLGYNRVFPDVSDKIRKARVFLGQNLSQVFRRPEKSTCVELNQREPLIFAHCRAYGRLRYTILFLFLKKNQNAPRPSEHPPVRGEKNGKTFRWDQRLQIQNLFMAFKRVPRWK